MTEGKGSRPPAALPLAIAINCRHGAEHTATKILYKFTSSSQVYYIFFVQFFRLGMVPIQVIIVTDVILKGTLLLTFLTNPFLFFLPIMSLFWYKGLYN